MKARCERFFEMGITSTEGRPPLCDLVPLSYGMEECKSGHSSSGIRDYWMIHCVSSGCGTLRYRGEIHTLVSGQLFILAPGEWHHYRADEQDPWCYSWICFRGERASDFFSLPPILSYPGDAFRRLLRAEEYGDFAAEYATGCLFEILSYLLREGRSGEEGEGYAERARRMVDALYMLPITVGEIAAQLSLDRRYLPRLFRARYGITLQEYLIRVRMENAVRFLREGHNAEEAGRLAGYEDPTNFYRMFKRYYGEGPSLYRKRLREAGAEGKRP